MAKLDLTALTLGPTAAAVRKQVTPQQWRQIVTRAHKRGYAVDSFLDPNTPGPLKERTPKYLRDQAMKTVATAYQPAYKVLSEREKRVNALDEKRKADNQYYLNWLNSQHQELAQQSAAADDALKTAATTIQASTAAAYDQAKHAAQQQLGQMPGTVSDFSNANALTAIDAHKAAGVGQVGATAQQAIQGLDTAQQTRELAGSSNFAAVAALESKRIADTWNALQDIASGRLDLKTKQGQDAAKLLQDAQASEVSKAQSNREFSALMEKLGIQAADTKSQIKAREAAAKLGRDKLNETISYHRQLVKAKEDALNTSNTNSDADFMAKWGVSRETFLGWTDKQRQQYLKRARERGIITGAPGGVVFTPKEIRSNQREYRAALNWATTRKEGQPRPGDLKGMVHALTMAKDAGGTVHDLKTGKIKFNPDGTPLRYAGYGLNDPLLAEAVAMVAIYGGVDKKLAKRVKDAYGISVPVSHVTFSADGPKLYDRTN